MNRQGREAARRGKRGFGRVRGTHQGKTWLSKIAGWITDKLDSLRGKDTSDEMGTTAAAEEADATQGGKVKHIGENVVVDETGRVFEYQSERTGNGSHGEWVRVASDRDALRVQARTLVPNRETITGVENRRTLGGRSYTWGNARFRSQGQFENYVAHRLAGVELGVKLTGVRSILPTFLAQVIGMAQSMRDPVKLGMTIGPGGLEESTVSLWKGPALRNQVGEQLITRNPAREVVAGFSPDLYPGNGPYFGIGEAGKAEAISWANRYGNGLQEIKIRASAFDDLVQQGVIRPDTLYDPGVAVHVPADRLPKFNAAIVDGMYYPPETF